jgi:mRNA interferase YafQ
MLKYNVCTSKKYRKNYKKLLRSGKDLSKLLAIIDKLALGIPLEYKHHDHALKGNLKGRRECHIEPDWLLMYERNETELVLLLIATGNHCEVLGME